MFSERDDPEQGQISQWYKYHQQQIEEKFKILNTDTLQEIRNKMKRKQTKNENDENMNLLEQERGRIIENMQEHVKECQHPYCVQVQQIVLLYGFSSGIQMKKDPVTFIVKHESTTGYIKTKCPVGQQFNKKMLQTHKILKGM